MGFQFSRVSADRLATVDPGLQAVINRAIQVSEVDFGIACGIRTLKEQQALHMAGKSQVDGISRRSRHQDGAAVDIYPWIGGRADYGIEGIRSVATAIAWAATEAQFPIRWGGAWTCPDIRLALAWREGMAGIQKRYVATRQRQGRKPFIDGPHFEIPEPEGESA